MSKPNLLAFSSSVGIYRNKRMRDLRRLLSKSIHVKVDFADLSPMLFQIVMAYAGENQIDGDFYGYSTEDWCEIFATNHVGVTASQASAIVKGFREVGLFDKDKIRSWMKYNRHLGDYEGIVKAKRKAAKMMHKKREQEARNAVKTDHSDYSKNGEKPGQKPGEKDSPSKQLWVIDQALLKARGQARRDLLLQKEQLLSSATGVDLSSPPPSPAPPPPPVPKKSAKQRDQEWELAYLKAGKEAIENGSPEILTESMVRALLKHGYKLPAEVERKFRKLFKETDNPVPE